MATIEELRKIRLEKLQRLRDAGVDPYPASAARTHTIQTALEDFAKLESSQEVIALAGRLMRIREHGQSTFADLVDGTGKIQLLVKADGLKEPAFDQFAGLYDIGDFVSVAGTVTTTKTGERTLVVERLTMLSKSLRPLPEKWHGLQDHEERFRKRYLDLVMNPEVRERFQVRSKIIRSIRERLETAGFMEVETPVLQVIPGGASARPFVTHLNALDLDLYLRIAPELYLKRLLAGGFEKIYELGRCFRNEGMDREHNPEFTELEFYWAYQSREGLMEFTEDFISGIVVQILGKTVIERFGKVVADFQTPWKRVTFDQALQEILKEDISDWHNWTDYEMDQRARQNVYPQLPEGLNKWQIADELFKKNWRQYQRGPLFLVGHPTALSPLAKKDPANPETALRFQVVAGGMEIINAFAELNDPLDQRERFEAQEARRDDGDEEAQRLDEEFIEALEHGIPPAAGLGLGVDRLVALLTDSPNLREAMLFPLMRPK
ncbi:lysine--tRNA ligase [Candidatus Parcubacteria bacterium]|nr:lysine--tRNA ligase [Candidatus Parcubacteria bacterium]